MKLGLKIVYILLIFLFLSNSLFAQKQFDIEHYIDRVKVNLQMQDHTIEAEVWDGERSIKVDETKWYTWFQSNMMLSTRGGYNGKVLHGSYVKTYLNRSIQQQGQYYFGLRNGQWKEWYENGELKSIETWKKGVLDGERTEFSPNGEVLRVEIYKNGALLPKPKDKSKGRAKKKHLKEKGS